METIYLESVERYKKKKIIKAKKIKIRSNLDNFIVEVISLLQISR